MRPPPLPPFIVNAHRFERKVESLTEFVTGGEMKLEAVSQVLLQLLAMVARRPWRETKEVVVVAVVVSELVIKRPDDILSDKNNIGLGDRYHKGLDII